MFSDEIYKNLSDNCNIVEQKSKLVEQVKTSPTNCGLNGIFGFNQDEAMRIVTEMARTLAQQILHLKKYISANFVCKSNSHGKTVPNELRNTK